MKVSSFQGFIEKISSSGPGSLFLACGTERVQLGRIRDAARSRFCETLGFEFSSFHAEDAEPGRLARLLAEPSLFSSGRLVRIPDADRLPSAIRAELVRSAADEGRTDALLVESTESSLRHAFNASVDRVHGAASFVCWEPFERDMGRWFDTLAKERGLSLPPGSRGILLSWAGGSLSRLDEAIERASVFSGGRSLTTAELAGLLTGVADPGVFDLADEIWAGRRGSALSTAWRLICAGEEPVALLALVQRQWERLEAARSLLAEGGGQKEIERDLGLSPTAASSLLSSAKSSSAPPVWVSAEALASSDLSLKTGGDPFVVFAGLIHSLTQG